MTAPPTPDPTSSSTPPGTPPPSPTAPPLPPAAEFRFGADAEPWMQGKTPAEVSAIVRDHLVPLAQRGLQSQQVSQPVSPPQPQAAQIAPDDYVTGAHLQTLGNQYQAQFAQTAQQYATPAIAIAANNSLEIAKTQFKREFEKYGPEIISTLARVPQADWTPDNIKRVVRIVQSEHLDELVNERVAQFATSPDPALRSTGANGSTTPSTQAAPDVGLTDRQREVLRQRGITPETVAQFAAKTGQTPAQWYERVGKYGIGDA